MTPDEPVSHATPAAAPARRVVVVLGMHRSGTSAVAGCLQRLGVDFGPRLMPATEDNPRGYYEHIDLVNLHDRLLLALDRSWDDVYPFPPEGWQDQGAAVRHRLEAQELLARDFPAAPLWGLKDPRLCHLLPWWQPLWRASNSVPLFLIVRRAPSEVAISLARRERFSFSKSYLLWLQHTLAAERFTRGSVRALIDFRGFVGDWRKTLESAGQTLGLPPWPESAEAGLFVEPALLRSNPVEKAFEKLPPWVEEADAAVRAGLAGNEGKMREGLDHVARMANAAASLYLPTPTEAAADLRQQLEASRRQAIWYASEWCKARSRAKESRARLSILRRGSNESNPRNHN